ncbi:MAG: hypothetical protein AAB573_01015 [Patescibacteria group bacterium]
MSHIIRAGERRVLSTGDVVEISKVKHRVPIREEVSHTAGHEAAHGGIEMALGGSFDELSVVPGPGYGGYVKGKLSPVAIAAPYVLGYGGAGSKDIPESDLGQLHALGYDPHKLAPHVHTLFNNNKAAFQALATAADDHGVITGSHARHIFNEANKGGEMKIKIERKDGSKKTIYVDGIKDTNRPLVIPVDLSARPLPLPRSL